MQEIVISGEAGARERRVGANIPHFLGGTPGAVSPRSRSKPATASKDFHGGGDGGSTGRCRMSIGLFVGRRRVDHRLIDRTRPGPSCARSGRTGR